MAANASSSAIHCNVCFVSYVDNIYKLFLLTCKHINCEKCRIVITPDIYRCAVCQTVTKACEINKNMSVQLKELFQPEPFLGGLNNSRLRNFQPEHRRDYLQHLEEEHDALEEKQKQAHSLKQDFSQEMFKGYQQLKNERKCLQQKVPGVRQQKNTSIGAKRKSISFSAPAPTFSSPFTLPAGPRMPAPNTGGQNSGEIATFKNFKTHTNSFFL